MLCLRNDLILPLLVFIVTVGASSNTFANCNSDLRICRSNARSDLNACLDDCDTARCRSQCRNSLYDDLDSCDASADSCMQSSNAVSPQGGPEIIAGDLSGCALPGDVRSRKNQFQSDPSVPHVAEHST
jgi:hypothetical protein